MKTKKIIASVLATVGAISCMATITASALVVHKGWSTRYCNSTSFTDSSDQYRNVNSCSYSPRVTQSCYYKATVNLSSIEHNYTKPKCYISGEKQSGGWTYFVSGRDTISNSFRMTNNWQWNPLYKNIDFETNSLCSRLKINY